MVKSKIVDRQEVLRWFEEGRTYTWMRDQYLDKYHIETGISMWANFRRREGLPRRIARDDNLIPWYVEPQHRYAYPILMLRAEARRRAGWSLTEDTETAVDAWIAGLERDGVVLHYDSETEDGWHYVPPRPEIDTDLIRVPERKTTMRRSTDRD